MRAFLKWFLVPAVVLAGLAFAGTQSAEAGRWRRHARYYGYYVNPYHYYVAPPVVYAPRVRVAVPRAGVDVRVGPGVDVRVGPAYRWGYWAW